MVCIMLSTGPISLITGSILKIAYGLWIMGRGYFLLFDYGWNVIFKPSDVRYYQKEV